MKKVYLITPVKSSMSEVSATAPRASFGRKKQFGKNAALWRGGGGMALFNCCCPSIDCCSVAILSRVHSIANEMWLMRPISDAVAASSVRQKCVRSRSQTTLTKFCPLLTTYLPPDNIGEGKIVDISSNTYNLGWAPWNLIVLNSNLMTPDFPHNIRIRLAQLKFLFVASWRC